MQTLHIYLPRFFVGWCRFEDVGDDFFVMWLYYYLSGFYFFSRGAIWVGWDHLCNLNLVERYPLGVDFGRVFGVYVSVVVNFFCLFERGFRVTEWVVTFCCEYGDFWGQGWVFIFRSMVLYFCGCYRELL